MKKKDSKNYLDFIPEKNPVDRNDRIFNFGGNGWYPAKDGYFRCVGAWCGDCSRRRNDA